MTHFSSFGCSLPTSEVCSQMFSQVVLTGTNVSIVKPSIVRKKIQKKVALEGVHVQGDKWQSVRNGHGAAD